MRGGRWVRAEKGYWEASRKSAECRVRVQDGMTARGNRAHRTDGTDETHSRCSQHLDQTSPTSPVLLSRSNSNSPTPTEMRLRLQQQAAPAISIQQLASKQTRANHQTVPPGRVLDSSRRRLAKVT